MAKGNYPTNWDTVLYKDGFNNTNLPGYLPILFAKNTLKKFYDESIVPRLTNVQYEAEFKKFGDKIYIRQKPTVNVNDYVVGTELSYERLKAPEPIEMVIDKAKYWAWMEDDLTTAQTDLKQYLSEAMDEAKQAMIDAIEPAFFDDIVNQAVAAGVGNYGATAGVISGSYNLGTAAKPIDLSATGETLDTLTTKATNLVADLYGTLKEQNVLTGSEKPFIVAPHKFLNVLAKSALSAAHATGDSESLVRRGQNSVGIVQGCELYTTNFLKNPFKVGDDGTISTTDRVSGVFPILCGTKDAMTWAMQVQKVEKLRHPTEFANVNRGMSVYGYKLIEPKALAVAFVKFTA